MQIGALGSINSTMWGTEDVMSDGIGLLLGVSKR